MTDGNNEGWGPRPDWLDPSAPWPPTEAGEGPDEGTATGTMAVPPSPESDEETQQMTRGELRAFLRYFAGVELPITTADLYEAAEKLKGLQGLQEQFQNIPIFGSMAGKIANIGLGPLIQQAAYTLGAYGQELLGEDADSQKAFAIFSELMRPPTPSIAKKPTAEEFMSDFDTAFTSHIEGLKQAGKISGEEAEFAYTNLRSQFLGEYMAKLSEFAKTGASPFALREVTRGERGIAPGTTAGKALEAATGPGVTEPTRVKEEISAQGEGAGEAVQRRGTELREMVEDVGTGVPREFISLPRLMPADFLTEQLSPESIRLRYAGSVEGGGRGTRVAPPGYASSPRRV